ncbi:MAG: MBL fold metallo-hydrolase [Oscillospiraceae bacterium]
MAFICSLASGSSGNALVCSGGDTHILLDAGISCMRIKKGLAALGLAPEQLSAVLITHSHSDHIGGLATFAGRYAVPIYASLPTAETLAKQIPAVLPRLRCFAAGDAFALGETLVQSFPTSHDAPGSVDFRIDGPGFSFGALTDTGVIPEEAAALLPGVDTLLLESNHDVEMLRSGPYPYPLKRRILSELGHLSNETAAAFARTAVEQGTRQVVLAHLSRENNTPALAMAAGAAALMGQGELRVAPRSEALRLEVREGANSLCRR